MKRMSIIKNIELAIFIVVSAVGFIALRKSATLSQLAAEYTEVMVLIRVLWFLVAAIFLMLFVDYGCINRIQKEYSDMKVALHSDALSQIANRNGCDQLIDKYIDKELPAGFTCAMLMLTNIYEINEKHGRASGNQAIQDFSVILHMAARNVGFAGRNGGNKFILLFEDANGADECEKCLERIREKVEEYNSTGVIEIKYAYGEASSSAGVKIHELIALADRSINTDSQENKGNTTSGGDAENVEV